MTRTLFMPRLALQRRFRPTLAHAVAALAPAVAWSLSVLCVPAVREMEAGGLWVVTFLVGVWSLVFSGFWWAGLDEASREAHKFAWYWGAGVGLILAMLIALPVNFRPVTDLLAGAINRFTPVSPKWRPESLTFFFGVLFAAVVQVIAFAIAWLGWWASRKIPR
jgi:hypothetical protein